MLWMLQKIHQKFHCSTKYLFHDQYVYACNLDFDSFNDFSSYKVTDSMYSQFLNTKYLKISIRGGSAVAQW